MKPTKLLWTPVRALWWRDVIRFLRQRNRIIGALATPLVFWLLVGSGFGPSFQNRGTGNPTYLIYFFPGIILLIMLFTAIFSTISVIEDRREGFLQGALVAPLSPAAIPLGKFLGGTTLAVLQALFFCLLAPLAGIHIGGIQLLLLLPALILAGFSMTGLGFLVAWPMDSTQGFHAIMNIFLMPLWMMSGALFPMPPGSGWLYWVGQLNPVSYCVSSIREALMMGTVGSSLSHYGLALFITALFGAATFGVSFYLVAYPRKK
jgi:ABC-2 type transport system permease protein